MRSILKKIVNWWRADQPPKKEVNYLYFSLLLIFLSTLSLTHFLWADTPLLGIPLFFLIYALGQAFLEICIFILIAYLLKLWAPKWAFLAFISFCFVLQLVHFTDFTLLRLMDASIAYLFKFFLGNGLTHLKTAFQALNLNLTMIAITTASIALIPIAGLLVFWVTQKVVSFFPLRISLSQIGIALLSIGATLLLLDLFAHPFLNRLIYTKYQKTLPFGHTFIPPQLSHIELAKGIAPARNEAETEQKIPPLQAAALPNIYFFVIETLRKDFITDEIAPHLRAFAEEHIQFPDSYSNANFTNLSWFSIFHSDFPYHWTAMRDEWKHGSIPLRILKKLGYKIRIYSSADLSYFDMDHLLFGQNRELADHVEEYTFNREIEPCDRDALALQSFERDLSENQGTVFLFFFDSTHSEYSFPLDFPVKFAPISKEIDYLSMGPGKKELEYMKNRYRNSIHYVDHLMGGFFDLLKKKGFFEEALIAITGDHGEEFFEEGALFHGTHLNHYQTSVPIFLKFPSKRWQPQTEETSHIDLFPSILHYLTGEARFRDLFDGQSVFRDDRWPYRMTVLQNGSEPPLEFSIERGDTRLHGRFFDSKESQLEIIELRVPAGEETTLEQKIETYFPNVFEALLTPH